MSRQGPQNAPQGLVDRSWHLAKTPLEVNLAELEYALMRAFEAFGHWQTGCLALAVNFSATGPENALLHIIRMKDRPKTIRDLVYMTNREDIPNIQYSLRKLIKGGLINRKGSGRAGVYYETTPLGRAVTDRYADIRADLLIDAIKNVPELASYLEQAARTLDLMTGIYAQAARSAATHRHRSDQLPKGVVSAPKTKNGENR